MEKAIEWFKTDEGEIDVKKVAIVCASVVMFLIIVSA